MARCHTSNRARLLPAGKARCHSSTQFNVPGIVLLPFDGQLRAGKGRRKQVEEWVAGGGFRRRIVTLLAQSADATHNQFIDRLNVAEPDFFMQ